MSDLNYTTAFPIHYSVESPESVAIVLNYEQVTQDNGYPSEDDPYEVTVYDECGNLETALTFVQQGYDVRSWIPEVASAIAYERSLRIDCFGRDIFPEPSYDPIVEIAIVLPLTIVD